MAHSITLAIRYLAEFLLRGGSIDSRFSGLDRAQEGSRIHRMLQKQGGKGYKAEVPLHISIEQEGIRYLLTGRADGVITTEDSITVDEIKTITQPLELLDENTHPEHWGQGMIYGHILCSQKGYKALTVQLTYYNVDTEETRRFTRLCSARELAEFVQGLLTEYTRWARLELEWADIRNESLRTLRFPFAEYREGQRNLAIASYQAFRDGGRLFACAPTGIGKTVSTLFPAMKALGEGCGERIFYLTAKTITRRTAEDTVALLRRHAEGELRFKSITLTAKDKICMQEERACLPELCEYANGYYDRLRDALYEILQQNAVFSREQVEEYAQKYRLCPYELSLDLASWCDCIVCDYNYLFDPVVHLQRFFEGSGGDYLFLVDEAHNLVDRSREMYSANLSKDGFFELKKKLPKLHTRMHKALTALNNAFVALRHECEEENAKVLLRYKLPEQLVKPVERFVAACEAFLEDNRGSEWENEILGLYFEALFYQRIAQGYDDTYVTLIYHNRTEVTAKLFCLDPAAFLDESLSLGRGAVLFSATLQPLPYYRETLGGGEMAKLTLLESPFPRENLGLYIADGISTKYADRDYSLSQVTEMLHELVAVKPGNYIAYFPSYSYMRQAYERFSEEYPQVPTLLQQSGMDEAQREEFLDSFAAGQGGTLLGFCVLGGIFAEGVDLAGDRLIGTAVVGVGLPQMGPEPDALRGYYDEKNDHGFEYAYQFPGMNKVLQAAGRVIRSDTDRGVVLLIDSRFTSARYQQLFPPHWAGWQRTSAGALRAQLEGFWSGAQAQG